MKGAYFSLSTVAGEIRGVKRLSAGGANLIKMASTAKPPNTCHLNFEILSTFSSTFSIF